MTIKNFRLLIMFFIIFYGISSCHTKMAVKTINFIDMQANKSLDLTFLQKNYERDDGKFSMIYDKTTEPYIKKWAVQHFNQQFEPFDKTNLDNIGTKNKINIKFRFSHETPIFNTDSIDIYINNKIFISGRYPSRLDYAWELKELPPYPVADLINNAKTANALICLVSHSQKIYFDTIVPLQYKGIDIIRLGKSFQFRFWGIK